MAFLTCSEHQSLEKEPSFVDSTGKSTRGVLLGILGGGVPRGSFKS